MSRSTLASNMGQALDCSLTQMSCGESPRARRENRMIENDRLKEKVVLVTAGSRGIGAEIARAFAAVGCKGIIGYRAGEVSANKLAAEMKAASVSITRHGITVTKG